MNTEKVIVMINEFIDGELTKEKENYLFSELSNNDTAREYFKKVNSLKLVTSNTFEPFPPELDSKLINRLKEGGETSFLRKWIPNSFSFFAYAVVAFILAFGAFWFNEYNTQQEQLELTRQQVQKQERLIQLIMTNQLPPVTVEPNTDNEIIVQAIL